MKVNMNTNKGLIVLELYEEHSPLSVANFVRYAKEGLYNGTVFHRCIRGFIIQGGGFDANAKPIPSLGRIQNESNNRLKNVAYTIAMARTAAPHTAESQFFINVVDNSFLDFKSESPSGWGYAVFGKVLEGFSVVNEISRVKTDRNRSNYLDDWPVENVVIETVEVVN